MAKYIDREVAVKAFNNFDAGRACGTHSTLLTPEEFAEYLYELPAADVAPVRHGHWIEDGDCQICSECGEEHEWDEYRAAYCDVCGAKMEVDNG